MRERIYSKNSQRERMIKRRLHNKLGSNCQIERYVLYKQTKSVIKRINLAY